MSRIIWMLILELSKNNIFGMLKNARTCSIIFSIAGRIHNFSPKHSTKPFSRIVSNISLFVIYSLHIQHSPICIYFLIHLHLKFPMYLSAQKSFMKSFTNEIEFLRYWFQTTWILSGHTWPQNRKDSVLVAIYLTWRYGQS